MSAKLHDQPLSTGPDVAPGAPIEDHIREAITSYGLVQQTDEQAIKRMDGLCKEASEGGTQ